MDGRKALAAIMLCTILLAGCTSPLGPPSPTAKLTVDVDEINVGEPINFDARDSTTPEGTINTEFVWNFGDGDSTTTSKGLTSHVYSEAGSYEVVVTVTNDVGGSDTARWTVNVNAFPTVALAMPTTAKVGEVVTLDSNLSSDPEGGELQWNWDLDHSEDSDGDGVYDNDIDSTSSSVSILVNESGTLSGSVTVYDDRGASATRVWEMQVNTRTWKVVWEQRRVTYDWDGWLEQGDTWTISHVPSDEGRLISVNATLTLEMDMLPTEQPQDNFTLHLAVPSGGWTESQTTSQENVTKAPTAYLDRDEMNPMPESEQVLTADHVDELMLWILDDAGARFGRGNWTWQVEAEQADPDFLIDGLDPDDGNDWDLEIEFLIMVPRISEVAI